VNGLLENIQPLTAFAVNGNGGYILFFIKCDPFGGCFFVCKVAFIEKYYFGLAFNKVIKLGVYA